MTLEPRPFLMRDPGRVALKLPPVRIKEIKMRIAARSQVVIVDLQVDAGDGDGAGLKTRRRA
jgi:hypothetical protein